MTMITPSYLGETIEYSSLHACRSTLEDPTEYLRYVEIARTLDLSPEVDHYFESLVSVHFRTFDLLARTVVAPGPDDHRAAFALNRKRVGIKAAIDRATRAPYGEVKDYYGAEAADD